MRNLLFIITFVMTVLLFVGNPLNEHSRLYQSLWNTGHVFFFGLVTWILINYSPLIKKSWPKMLLVSLLFTLVLGGLIEVVQYKIGRYMEWLDLLFDLLGALLGFLAVQFLKPKVHKFATKPVIVLMSIGLLLAAFYPTYTVVIDELNIEANFPMIADFESAKTLQRWKPRDIGRLEIDSNLYRTGRSSAWIEFGLGDYPAFSLLALYSNWSAYNFLNISVHNDQSEDLILDVKIYDHQHLRQGHRFADRFNREVRLVAGWNDIEISLLDILRAPQDRMMNLQDIAGLTVFIHNPAVPKSIHLDNIHLYK